jgi:hypothetical protein
MLWAVQVIGARQIRAGKPLKFEGWPFVSTWA